MLFSNFFYFYFILGGGGRILCPIHLNSFWLSYAQQWQPFRPFSATSRSRPIKSSGCNVHNKDEGLKPFYITLHRIALHKIILPLALKLDRLGPIDNRPSPNSLHYFVKKMCSMTPDTWHLIRDTWHMTCDTWHVICDMWQVSHGGIVSEDFFFLFFVKSDLRLKPLSVAMSWNSK